MRRLELYQAEKGAVGCYLGVDPVPLDDEGSNMALRVVCNILNY